GALVDAHYSRCIAHVDRYQLKTASIGHALLKECDARYAAEKPEDVHAFLEECNQRSADLFRSETDALLWNVLNSASIEMKNAFSRADA
ncbi:MAG: dipeptidase, partial [Oscillospiraceae bacterium]|nr:dipeptidase [Oscillospiraceae bacterium]